MAFVPDETILNEELKKKIAIIEKINDAHDTILNEELEKKIAIIEKMNDVHDTTLNKEEK